MGLTAAQAAQIIDTTPAYVDLMVHRGLLPKARPGQRAGLAVEDVERASLERLDRSRPHPYWVSRAEAAEVLGVTARRVSQLAERERIPGVRYEGHWYFRRHQLEVVANARDARKWANA